MFENKLFSNIDLRKLNKYLSKNECWFLSRLHWWLSNEKEYGVEKDGKTWIYNTLDGWAEQLGISQSSVRRAIKSLKEKEFIITDQLSWNKRNRTLYYAIDYENIKNFLSDRSRTKRAMSPCVQKPSQNYTEKERINEHLDEHMYISVNSKQIINKSNKSENISEKNFEHPKLTIVQDMIKIWNEEFKNSPVRITKNIARYLVAAFKAKFQSNLKEWRKFLKILQTSAYIMSEKFKLTIMWVLKFCTIDRIRAGDLGADPEKVSTDQDELTEKFEDHMQKLNEPASCKELRKKIKEKLSLSTYLSWFTHVSFSKSSDSADKIIMKASSTFVSDWIMNNFANQCGLDNENIICE